MIVPMPTGPDVNPGASPAPRPAHGLGYEDFVAQLYGLVVQLGRPTRADLLERGYHPDAIEQGMAELAARGFVQPLEGDPDAWRVPSPRAAFTAYAEQVEHRLGLGRATIGQMELLWRRSVGRPAAADLPPEVDLLLGIEDIVVAAGALLRDSVGRRWLALDGSPASRLLARRLVEEHTLLGAGADVRVIIDTGLLDDEAVVGLLHELAGGGHHVRVGNGIPFTLVLGEDEALVDLSTFDAQGAGSFSTRMGSAVAAVARLVEEVFLLSTQFGPTVEALSQAESAPPLDARDRQILSLLTVGASDQVVARQVGVSLRTVERRVRYLMEHLGAATRFQAGVQAVRRGWV